MAATETLPGPDGLDDDQREAVEALLFRLADDEFVAGDRYTDWQVRSPTLESDLALANIAQDEIGHARLWYDLLEDFGYEEADLIWDRPAADFVHASLCELAFGEGDWADVIVRSYLYDAAEAVRLEALRESSYPRLRDRVEKVIGEEDYHVNHARRWLERLVETDDGRQRVQAALDRLHPYALTLFAPTDEAIEARIDELGLRTASLAELRERWRGEVDPFLEGLDLEVPDDSLPEAVGRDGSHTDDWTDQHEELTRAYRELGRHQIRRLMEDPDDVE